MISALVFYILRVKEFLRLLTPYGFATTPEHIALSRPSQHPLALHSAYEWILRSLGVTLDRPLIVSCIRRPPLPFL